MLTHQLSQLDSWGELQSGSVVYHDLIASCVEVVIFATMFPILFLKYSSDPFTKGFQELRLNPLQADFQRMIGQMDVSKLVRSEVVPIAPKRLQGSSNNNLI